MKIYLVQAQWPLANVFRRKRHETSAQTIFHLAAGAAALPALPHIAGAQAHPTRPVRMIVPFAPAGTTDIVARLMGQWLSERLGQHFIVENDRAVPPRL